METHLLFDTNAFNLSEVGEHFINPCCFGQDAVAWFIVQLGALGYWTDLAGQEDWGWYACVSKCGARFFLAVSGRPDDESSAVNGVEEEGNLPNRRHQPGAPGDKALHDDRTGRPLPKTGSADSGEWRIILKERRSLTQMLSGRHNRTAFKKAEENLRRLIETRRDFHNLRSD